jgi:hypothetical protein
MNNRSRVWKIGALGLLLLAGLGGCAVEGVGYGGDAVGVGYVGGFYEPYGYEYGGWGRGYRVGPPRGDIHGGGGRSAPSIPSGPRGGGGHGGGGHR